MPGKFGYDDAARKAAEEEEKRRKYLDQIKGPIIPLVSSILKDFLSAKNLGRQLWFFKQSEDDWLIMERSTGVEIVRVVFNYAPGITIRMQQASLLPLPYAGYVSHLQELAGVLEKHTCLPVELTENWHQ